jgi:crotonobetainyl-CoA:carnitine CoA-transferase CaiB-like acyl-CoA transferase
MSTDAPPSRSASPQVSIWMEPPYGVYSCRTGYLALAQSDLDLLADIIGAPDLKRFKTSRPNQRDSKNLADWRDEIYQIIAARFADEDNSHWDRLLTERGVWCGPVNDYAAFLAHPQTQRYLATMEHSVGGPYRTVAPAIHFSDNPAPELRGAPRYGENTSEILRDAGFSVQEIEALITSKAAVQRVAAAE